MRANSTKIREYRFDGLPCNYRACRKPPFCTYPTFSGDGRRCVPNVPLARESLPPRIPTSPDFGFARLPFGCVYEWTAKLERDRLSILPTSVSIDSHKTGSFWSYSNNIKTREIFVHLDILRPHTKFFKIFKDQFVLRLIYIFPHLQWNILWVI